MAEQLSLAPVARTPRPCGTSGIDGRTDEASMLLSSGEWFASLHGLAPSSLTLATTKLVVSTNLRSEFVVLAPTCVVIEPQAALLRFVTAPQSREMKVEFVDQFPRQVGGSKRMRLGVFRTRGIEHDRRSNSHAAGSAAIARTERKNWQFVHSPNLVRCGIGVLLTASPVTSSHLSFLLSSLRAWPPPAWPVRRRARFEVRGGRPSARPRRRL